MNARRRRTGPNTFVSKTARMSSTVASLGLTRPPLIPALLTKTSSAPTVSVAAATEASSVTSSCTNRAPSASAAKPTAFGIPRPNPDLMAGRREPTSDLKAKAPVRSADQRRCHAPK